MRIVTVSFSRRTSFRNTSWMLGGAFIDDTRDGSNRGWRIAGTVEPRKIRLFAKPDQLPARVPAVLLRDERARRRLVTTAVQMLERLPVYEPAERPRRFWNPTREQCSNLVE